MAVPVTTKHHLHSKQFDPRTAVRRCGDTDNNCYKWALEGGCENSSATWQFVFHNMEYQNAKKTHPQLIGSLKRKHDNEPWEFGLPDL